MEYISLVYYETKNKIKNITDIFFPKCMICSLIYLFGDNSHVCLKHDNMNNILCIEDISTEKSNEHQKMNSDMDEILKKYCRNDSKSDSDIDSVNNDEDVIVNYGENDCVNNSESVVVNRYYNDNNLTLEEKMDMFDCYDFED